jgi:hypothetical protein
MRFYVITSKIDGSVFDCKTSLAQARSTGRRELGPDQFTVDMVECPVNADTVCKLLSNRGGYASEVKRVFGED